ncbi:MAG: hypothetical protein ACREQW_23630 [Candidatus Binatia bacterium]
MLRLTASFVIVAMLFAITGSLTLLFATREGVGVSPDSTYYLAAARSLMNGQGLTAPALDGEMRPLTQFPPLFPALIALAGIAGIEPLAAARWINGAFFAGNIFLVGLILYRLTRGSFLVSVLGAFLTLTAVDLLEIHAMAWTEPGFIFLILAGSLLLGAYLAEGNPVLIFAAATAAALALLDRYAGISFALAGVITFLIRQTKSRRCRIAGAGIFFLLSTLPVALWVLHNKIVAGSATDREVAWHFLSFAHVKSGAGTLLNWFLPQTVTGYLAQRPAWAAAASAGIVLAALAGSGLWRRRNWRLLIDVPLAQVLSVFTGVYTVFVVCSITFFDARTLLDSRILAPVFICVMILILYLVHSRLRSATTSKAFCLCVAFFTAFFVGSYSARAGMWLSSARQNGFGTRSYASKVWRQSELIEEIRGLPAHLRLYTNGPEVIYFLLGKRARLIPAKANRYSQLPNERYLSQLSAMANDLESKKGVLVYFKTIGWRSYVPTEDELTKNLPLVPLATLPEGSIYQ